MSKTQAFLPQADMRGFKYDLTPFAQKQEWVMESLQRRLSKAQTDLTKAQAHLSTLQGGLQAQSEQIQKSLIARADPTAHQRGLEFLVSLLQRIDEQRRTIEKLHVEKTKVQTECLAQQCKLDGLAEHLVQAQSEFAIEQARLAASEADREWIGRLKRRAQYAVQLEDGT
jgi:uncharacterized coiled-coil protein SlyX